MVAHPPAKDALASSPPAMACRIKPGLRPEIRQAAPMSIVAAITPPRRMAVKTSGTFLCTGIALQTRFRVSHDRCMQWHTQGPIRDSFRVPAADLVRRHSAERL